MSVASERSAAPLSARVGERRIQPLGDLRPDVTPGHVRVDVEVTLANEAALDLVDRPALRRDLERAFDDGHVLHARILARDVHETTRRTARRVSGDKAVQTGQVVQTMIRRRVWRA